MLGFFNAIIPYKYILEYILYLCILCMYIGIVNSDDNFKD